MSPFPDADAGQATRRADETGRSPAPAMAPAVQVLAAMESADDRQLRRALIQGLLSDQFGKDMLNAPRFQQVVDRVTAAIEGDEARRALLDRMTAELRGTRPDNR